MRNALELLSPARDAQIGIQAINHGADAVYLAGSGFGARDKAANSVSDIEKLARHAHRWHARVFVTMNTILRDDELEGARRQAWQLYEAGADALIVQDMGLLRLDLPPLQLHASTQTDIRSPQKARFLQDVGFSQMVLARELTLDEIAAIAKHTEQAVLEFFIHGALCVAYSGQCYISHALNGRSANRGSCSQECRQPYTVLNGEGAVVAHEQHVLSLKDNDQSANLAALVDAGIRSFKIEGRYKDMATVKNVTAHYRQLCDRLLEQRSDLQAASHGQCRFSFAPDPQRGFNRGATDYFVNGRKMDIGAFASPKHVGLPLGEVLRLGADHLDVNLHDIDEAVHNNDAITWTDLQGQLQGVPINVAKALGGRSWRLFPNAPMESLKGLKPGAELSRNRDMAWERALERPSSERFMPLWASLHETQSGYRLELADSQGHRGHSTLELAHEDARDALRAQAQVQEQLARLGGTGYELADGAALALHWQRPRFIPSSALNALRREAVAALDAARAAAFTRLPRSLPAEPPVAYPEDSLSYLANVYNHQAAAFYAQHGVKVIAAAYESHEEPGEVSLMITKHCVRFSLSLCPKQAKGVVGVQGQVRAEPLTLVQGQERFTLRFDCKPCEMHVVGKAKPSVLKGQVFAPTGAGRLAVQGQARANLPAKAPIRFYRQRPV